MSLLSVFWCLSDEDALGRVVGAVGCEGCVGKSINASIVPAWKDIPELLGVKIQMVKGNKKKKKKEN